MAKSENLRKDSAPSKLAEHWTHNTPPPYVDGDKTHTRTQRMNTFYPRKFSTNYLIYILNFNIW